MYKFEKELYLNTHLINIKPKIRQQLQYQDKGYLTFDGDGTYTIINN